MKRKIIIVGAGLGGLGAGLWLLKEGYEVEIYEASNRPGGRMHTQERKGDKFEVGALFYHTGYKYSEQLMRVVNIHHTRRPIHGMMQFMLENGSAFKYNHNIPFLPPLGLKGNLKLYSFMLKNVFFTRKDPLHQISTVRPEWDNMLCTDIWPSNTRVDKLLRNLVMHPLSFASNQGFAEYLNLHHAIHLMRIDTFTGFVALTGGTSSLTNGLGELLKEHIRYETPVKKLIIEKNKVHGVILENGESQKADHVIVAATPNAVSRLLPEQMERQKKLFDQIIGVPYPVAIFFLDKMLNKKVWGYFADMGNKRDFMWAMDHAVKAPHMVPSGKSILSAFPGHPLSIELIKKTDSEIIETARKDVELFVPGFSKYILNAMIYRHDYGVARYPEGSYTLAVNIKNRCRDIDGFSLVTDFTGGSYLESSLISAKEAVDRILLNVPKF